jgi:pyrimidine-nucleoside phosphorylase
MSMREWIELKKRGRALDSDQLAAFVRGVVDDSIPDYQLAAFLMAVWHRGLDARETRDLTFSMRDSGRVLDWGGLDGPTADKHSTGGIGDKISLVLAPLAAELGLYVPMLSGRGLGHTGGTLDKLEAIDGFRIDLELERFQRQVRQIGCAIIGQSDDIAPADRRLYHLRDVTATVDSIPLIVSSILSKKLAAGPRHLVFDLKVGSGAFMRDPEAARQLARALLDVATLAERKASALLTDMGQPLGRAVGHALECAEAIACLRGGGPADLREVTIALTVEMAELADLGAAPALRRRASEALDSGRAYERFCRMAKAQGADPKRFDGPDHGLRIAAVQREWTAPRSGFVRIDDAATIGMALLPLRGARLIKDSKLDLSTGLECLVRQAESVQAGQALVRIRAHDSEAAAACERRLAQAIAVSESPPDTVPLVLERMRTN